jgi:TRAP-type uncharacterized transport system fused permease subunit
MLVLLGYKEQRAIVTGIVTGGWVCIVPFLIHIYRNDVPYALWVLVLPGVFYGAKVSYSPFDSCDLMCFISFYCFILLGCLLINHSFLLFIGIIFFMRIIRECIGEWLNCFSLSFFKYKIFQAMNEKGSVHTTVNDFIHNYISFINIDFYIYTRE